MKVNNTKRCQLITFLSQRRLPINGKNGEEETGNLLLPQGVSLKRTSKALSNQQKITL